MVEISMKRLVTILARMVDCNAEVIVNITNDECYLFFGIHNNQLPIKYEEVDCLIELGIIDLDSGCDEEGHESRSYRLTEIAQQRIQTIIESRRRKPKIRKALSA